MALRQGRAVALIGLVSLAGCIPRSEPPPGYGQAPPRPRPTFRPRPPARALPEPQPEASVPQPTPAWVARKVRPDAQTVPDSIYVVRPGDTLGAIGARTGAGADAIARANQLSPPYHVVAGERLHIPGGRYHRVQEGDTGLGIGQAYGIPWSEIATANDLQPPYILHVGQRLLLPGGPATPQQSLEQRAQAFNIDIDDLATGSEPAIAENEKPKKATASPRRPLPADVAVAAPRDFSGRFAWPLHGKLIGRFGPTGDGRRNDGINIAAEMGEPVRAAADGVVAYAGSAIAVYGGLILIKHGGGWITAYGHVGQILVTRGQSVKAGEVIARAGATGAVNQPQLHFEIRDKRTPVDPLHYLPGSG